jgi:hypothetical protein
MATVDIPEHTERRTLMDNKKRDIGDSNAEQNEYWIRVGGHPPPEQQDGDDDCYCPSCERINWKFTAVRSFFRLYAIRTKGWDEMEGCDSHYDGGEWSGPAWAKNWEDEYVRTAEHIAERFNFDLTELYNWIEKWQYSESHYYQDAMMKMTRRTK